MKQPFRTGHRHQRGDFSTASRLTEDGDEIGVAAEAGDIVSHPLERGDDVEQAHAAREREVGSHRIAEIRVTEHIEPMIDGHDDDVVRLREAGAIENAAGAGAAGKSAAVQPHHHRAFASIVQAGREDVQHETVFALLSGRSGGDRSRVVPGLRRGGAEGERVAGTGPCDGPARRHEAILSAGGCAIRNALEHLHAVHDEAPDFASRRLRDGVSEVRGADKFQPRRKLRTRNRKARMFHEASSAGDVRHVRLLR